MRRDALAVGVRWLDALGGGDADAFLDLLSPSVAWSGIPSGAMCRGRDEVIKLLRTQMTEGLPDAYAVELVAGDRGVVVGYRAEDLTMVMDEPLPGQVFNVLTVADGKVVAIDDFARRAQALVAAGAGEPGWI